MNIVIFSKFVSYFVYGFGVYVHDLFLCVAWFEYVIVLDLCMCASMILESACP